MENVEIYLTTDGHGFRGEIDAREWLRRIGIEGAGAGEDAGCRISLYPVEFQVSLDVWAEAVKALLLTLPREEAQRVLRKAGERLREEG